MTTDDDLVDVLRTAVAKSSLRRWAVANGFSPSFISLVLNGKSKMTPMLAAVLGYEKIPGWMPAKSRKGR
jgi:hypothetical protein